jgi:hypothetical protein
MEAILIGSCRKVAGIIPATFPGMGVALQRSHSPPCAFCTLMAAALTVVVRVMTLGMMALGVVTLGMMAFGMVTLGVAATTARTHTTRGNTFFKPLDFQ